MLLGQNGAIVITFGMILRVGKVMTLFMLGYRVVYMRRLLWLGLGAV